MLPYADAAMMQLHLDEISRNVAEGAHAVLLLDRAGWHTTGKLDVPDKHHADLPAFPRPGAEPGRERLAGSISATTGSSNTVFENYDAIVDAAYVRLGESSSLNPKRDHLHRNAARLGLTSVTRYDRCRYNPVIRSNPPP